MRKNILNLLILLEAAAFVIVICAAIFFGNSSSAVSMKSDDISSVSDAETDSEEKNVQTSADSAKENSIGDGEEEITDNSISESSDQDQNEEEELSFSDEVESKLSEMSVEEKAAQLFITTPEELTGADQVTIAGGTTQSALASRPVGGLIYSEENFTGAEQIASMIGNTQTYADDSIGIELIAIVEETGGENHSPLAVALNYEITASPAELAEEGNLETVSAAASLRAGYAAECGFNMILGPVADTATGTDSDFDDTTYGSDITSVSQYVAADAAGTLAEGVVPVVRAFPGLSEITEDYTVYQAAMEAGVTCIQISALPSSSLTGDNELPCSLSEDVVRVLRDEIEFDGLLMTSDLAESSISDYCAVGEAAVAAVNAGMDMIFITNGFEEAYQAVLDAVNEGEISEIRLNNSVGRLLSEKLD